MIKIWFCVYLSFIYQKILHDQYPLTIGFRVAFWIDDYLSIDIEMNGDTMAESTF